MFDSHLHTEYSTDSRMKIEDAVNRAKEVNLGIVITEHMDIYYPEDDFKFNPEEYLSKFSKYKSKNVLLGIELGMRQDCVGQNTKIALDNNFDFILGSIHFIDTKDIYNQDTYSGKCKIDVYKDYFLAMEECIRLYPYIDSLAHIDYICRYSPYIDNEIDYEEFADIIDSIFTCMVKNDIALEINTRRFQDKCNIEKLMKLYKGYKELGGKFITIGSDSHITKDIGSNFKTALEIAKATGLKIVHFENRKIEYDKII